MIAVIFEVWPAEGEEQHYLDLAAALRAELVTMDGFISTQGPCPSQLRGSTD